MSLSLLSSVAAAQTRTGPVVVELFTSEGCSSCPPADRLLAKLQSQHSIKGTELILLGEHVDYWDQLGWHDRFSQHAFTERQGAYLDSLRTNSAYTPQAVVNGTTEVLGNDEAAMLRAIDAGSMAAKPAEVTLRWTGAELEVSVEGAPSNASVLLFVTEDDLTTIVKAGENHDSTLHHAAVVREMRILGDTKRGALHRVVKVGLSSHWQPNKLRFIVIAQQQHGSGPIVGADAIALVDGPTSQSERASR